MRYCARFALRCRARAGFSRRSLPSRENHTMCGLGPASRVNARSAPAARALLALRFPLLRRTDTRGAIKCACAHRPTNPEIFFRRSNAMLSKTLNIIGYCTTNTGINSLQGMYGLAHAYQFAIFGLIYERLIVQGLYGTTDTFQFRP